MVSVKLVYAATLLSLAIAAQNDNANAGKGAVANAKQGQTGQQQNGNANAKANANANAANGAKAAANGANANANANAANANNANNAAKASANANAGNAAKGTANTASAAAKGVAASSSSASAASASTSAASGNAANNKNNNNNNNNNAAAAATSTDNSGADGTTLLPNAIQSGSFFDGQDGLGADAGQAASTISKNNFINFCAGQTLTNGLQITSGSCNGIVMGQIPAKTQMISTVITFPQDGQSIDAGKDFNITVQVNNLKAGAFTNADTTYYAAPQQLVGGIVQGHTHVTVQDMGKSLNPTTPPDPTQFAFFKGINDPGNGEGGLAAIVAGGLPVGNYRVCTLTSASNHQPVIMPVAQRGSQDDCTRFTVTGSGGTTNVAANNGDKGQAAAALAQSAVGLGPGAITATAAAAQGSATAAAAAANNNNGKNGNANAGAGAKAGANAGAGAKAGTNANAGAKASANAGANAGAKAGANAGANANANGGKKVQRLARLSRRTFVA